MSSDRTIHYRPDLDGLRCVAVLLVLIFHFGLMPFGEGGFLGVDVFFVISGFLITSIILKQLEEESFSFKEFYIRRIRRLAPPLFVTLVLVLAVGAFILLPADYEELSRQVLVTQLYASNIYFWQNVNYFGLQADSVPLIHTWSLAVEEQFYLFFPLALFLTFKFARRFFWPLLITGGLVSFALNIFFVLQKPELTFYLMPTRAWEFLLGSLAVLVTGKISLHSRPVRELLAALGMALILGSVLLYDEEVIFPGWYALYPSLGTMLVIIAGCSGTTFWNHLLGQSVPVYVGKLSYSLYLLHWPLHIFASYSLEADYTLAWRYLMFAVTFLLAVAMLHLVEEPARRGDFFKSSLRVQRYYTRGLIGSIVVSLGIIAANGVAGRFPDRVVQMASFSLDQPPAMLECQFKEKNGYEREDFCQIGAQDADPKWIVFGDSHAWAARAAFDTWLQRKGEAGLFIFRHACPPLMNMKLFHEKGQCFRFNRNVYDYIERHESLENVVLVSTWVYGKDGYITHDPMVLLSPEDSRALFDKSFAASIDFLNQLDRKVYIWGPVPAAKAPVPKTLAKSSNWEETSREISYTLEEHLENHAYFYEVVEANRDGIHQLFSPAQALCLEQKLCRVTVGEQPVYFDGSHLTWSLSDFWADVLRRQEKQEPVILHYAARQQLPKTRARESGAHAAPPPQRVNPARNKHQESASSATRSISTISPPDGRRTRVTLSPKSLSSAGDSAAQSASGGRFFLVSH